LREQDFAVIARSPLVPAELVDRFLPRAKDMSDQLTTTISRRWLIKLIAVCLAGFGFMGWGLYDALSLYPKRGLEYAETRERIYLERLAASPGRMGEATVAEPKSTLTELEARETDLLENERTFATKLASSDRGEQTDAQVRLLPKAVEYARFDWLRALNYAWELKPERTMIAEPAARLKALKALHETRDAAVPISKYDMLLQWGYVFAGAILGVATLVHLIRGCSKSYRYVAATHTLTLPGGRTIAAADLVELDRRRWHKFYVTLLVRDGKPVEIDLYKYEPLEEWVLDMERAAGLTPPAPTPEAVPVPEPTAGAAPN